MYNSEINIFSDQPEQNYIKEIPLLERKKIAQFFTPYPIARFMAKWLDHPHITTILDPAFGLGILIRAMGENQYQNLCIQGFDIDEKNFEFQPKIFTPSF